MTTQIARNSSIISIGLHIVILKIEDSSQNVVHQYFIEKEKAKRLDGDIVRHLIGICLVRDGK